MTNPAVVLLISLFPFWAMVLAIMFILLLRRHGQDEVVIARIKQVWFPVMLVILIISILAVWISDEHGSRLVDLEQEMKQAALDLEILKSEVDIHRRNFMTHRHDYTTGRVTWAPECKKRCK